MIAERVSYIYPRKGAPTIKDVDLQIEKGVVGLFGPNGSGKTTLLKCLAGILKESEGTIKIGGREVKKMNTIERSKLISYVPQELELNMPFTVFDVVMMGRNPHQHGMYPSEEDMKSTKNTLTTLEIEYMSDDFFTELSGGQKQLTSIARAVNQDSGYILLDEPVSNLDYSNAHRIWTLLRELSEERTIVISSHDPNQILRYCDEVILLHEGSILEKGTPEKTINESNLERLFGIPVDFGRIGDTRMVSPK